MSTDNYTHPQLDRLTSVIYTARWLTAIRNGEMATDREIAKAVLQEGFVIPQATLPAPVFVAPAADYSSECTCFGQPHGDCCK